LDISFGFLTFFNGICLIVFSNGIFKEGRATMDHCKRTFVLGFCLLLILCLPYDAFSLSKPPSPVIFIHGIASSSQAWLPITSFLRAEGWTFGGFPTFDAATGSVTSVFPGDFYTLNFSDYNLPQFRSQNLSFAQQGAELATIIQAVLQANPGKIKVTLVGHSMGGLAARAYLQGLAQVNSSSARIAYRRDVIQLITIGTPHKGAEVAVMCSQFPWNQICADPLININATSIAAQSLQPNSNALDRTQPLGLNNLINNPLPAEVKYVSIVVIGIDNFTILGEGGDGIVSIASQNLGMLADADGLVHQSKRILIKTRTDCGAHITGVFAEVHTCEPGDSDVRAELLNQLYQCHTINSGDPVPPSYGAPYNVLARQQELLLTASCTADTTDISVGNNNRGDPAQNYNGRQLVYNQGYEWTGSQWQQVNFQCVAEIESNIWCVGSATDSIPISSPWYLALTCMWTGNQWKCGCRDLSCTPSNLWQIQGIRR
jgi:triacylglycerol lipase